MSLSGSKADNSLAAFKIGIPMKLASSQKRSPNGCVRMDRHILDEFFCLSKPPRSSKQINYTSIMIHGGFNAMIHSHAFKALVTF
jgi:hypothetical protein